MSCRKRLFRPSMDDGEPADNQNRPRASSRLPANFLRKHPEPASFSRRSIIPGKQLALAEKERSMLQKLGFVLAGMCLIAVAVLFRPQASRAQPVKNKSERSLPPAPSLPIAQVMLFSSGVGYFQRQGEIDGTRQVELSFPGSDINDLLKSLVLQDADGGTITTITYDR